MSSCPSDTEALNLTQVTDFLLLRISEDQKLQTILFGLFLSMYLITVLGNLLIILAVTWDPHLHNPMYFFLSILSLDAICFISTTIPKMLVNLRSHSRAISSAGCLTQMCLFIFFCCMDIMLLLTVIAYGHFVAICHPLNSPLIMSPHLCVSLVLLSFVISFFDGQMHGWMTLQMADFKELEIPNFFCDPSQILDLSCKDTLTNAIFIYVAATVYGLPPLFGILFSYYKIISSVLRIPVSGGKCKAFSTCGSHLSVVCLFFGASLGVYIGSAVSHSRRCSAVSSVMYTVVTIFLNPFINSLRSRDFKIGSIKMFKPGGRKSINNMVL